MRLSKPAGFLTVLAAFLTLGIPFKVMVLVEGFTEVRPVNALPPVAGMIFGPTGALACGVGNVIADLFGTFNATSLLGLFGNFAAAYLPYRMWHIYSDEEPNLHKNGNILKYVLICFTAALSVSWFLGLGLYYFFGTWVEQVYAYVFFNNLGFSIGLGMPLFIMLSSEDVKMRCAMGPKRYWILRNKKLRKLTPVLYTAALAVIMVSVLVFHDTPAGNPVMGVCSVLALCGMAMICI